MLRWWWSLARGRAASAVCRARCSIAPSARWSARPGQQLRRASLPQIRIDPVSAGLLESARFELWPLGAGQARLPPWQ